jgi:hypothetical protein
MCVCVCVCMGGRFGGDTYVKKFRIVRLCLHIPIISFPNSLKRKFITEFEDHAVIFAWFVLPVVRILWRYYACQELPQ